MSKIMQGKWNHSKQPSEYEVFDSDGELLYSGAFVDAMKYMEEKKMEIMDDHDAGFESGKGYAQEKILSLMDEVIDEYRTHARAEKMDSESSKIPKAQLNAVLFMKHWVLNDGLTDEEGNRACLVW